MPTSLNQVLSPILNVANVPVTTTTPTTTTTLPVITTSNTPPTTTNLPLSVSVTGPNPTGAATVGLTLNADGTLANGTTITLLPTNTGSTNTGSTPVDLSSLLQITSNTGSDLLSVLGLGDAIDITNVPSSHLQGNTLSTPQGNVDLGTPPAGTTYQIVTNSSGQTQVVVVPKTIDIYRFFDKINGTQFYTADVNERNTILATRPDLVPEGPNGVGLQAIDPASKDPNAVSVYRFFDTKLGTHFFTASVSERDAVIANRPDLVYEPNGSFLEHATQQAGDKPVYRFFDSVHGTHFYTDSETERASVLQTRPDLVAEGIGFYEPTKNT